jgi:hypothetical protein
MTVVDGASQNFVKFLVGHIFPYILDNDLKHNFGGPPAGLKEPKAWESQLNVGSGVQ